MALGLAAGASQALIHRRVAAPSSRQQQQRGGLLPARASSFNDGRELPASFNEGAAQVRRLVDRDRKELSLEELEATFAEEAVPGASAPSAPSSAAEADGSPFAAAAASSAAAAAGPVSAFQVNSSVADKTPVSPFGPASSSPPASSPFATGGSAAVKRSPFAEPAGLSPNMPTPKADTAPWWTKITLTQIVIVASFTTIIALMISTFFFVLGTGAIHFNDQ